MRGSGLSPVEGGTGARVPGHGPDDAASPAGPFFRTVDDSDAVGSYTNGRKPNVVDGALALVAGHSARRAGQSVTDDATLVGGA